jgi:Holliday junction DNA helicase RuvA
LIALVSGRVTAAGPDGAVVDVGGVGLSVQCTPATLASLRVGDRAHVPTSLVVREDSLTLYGFADDDERSVFELLQTASGVGPRLALAMLAVHSPNALRRAVTTEDLAALTLVPGIGKKGAQRIVLELKDRLGGPIGDGGGDRAGAAPTTAASWRVQVHTGLVNLGWPARDADAAVDAVAADLDGHETPDVGTLLKSALKKLSRP